MWINTAWLLDYLDPQPTHRELLEAFTVNGLEVEEWHDLAEELKPVVIGFVREKEPIAAAPGMNRCKIEIAPEKFVTVMCTSEHEVEVGWGVPVAVAGTKLPTGAEIREGTFYGVDSQGMICPDGEMGLVARGKTGLQVFQDESLMGKPLPEVSPIEELLVDLAILANRPDCLGMLGIAREISAMLNLSMKWPTDPPPEVSPERTGVVPVSVEEAKLCPRYLCQLIRGVEVKSSPDWLKSRLLAVGKRPINNVVDITNFVLLEWGQPLHAFDFATLKGGQIQVRLMKPDETLELLDETILDEASLKGKPLPLVIADAERPVALAGIMGGTATQTRKETVDILLEAACFDSVNIRATRGQFDLNTDSSYRFERGTDPNFMLLGALQRATELIQELAGGTLEGEATDVYPETQSRRILWLSRRKVESYLGMPMQTSTIVDCLEKLGMFCQRERDELGVQVPTWRVDATDPVVLIEDVARQVGYDKIPLQSQSGAITAGITSPLDHRRSELAEFLAANGFLETRNPPLQSVKENALFAVPGTESIVVQNPKNKEMKALRTSLLSGLLATVQRNANRGLETFRCFETDRVFRLENGNPLEQWSISGMLGGTVNDSDWLGRAGAVEFYHIKGVVETMLETLGISEFTFTPGTDRATFQKGYTATIQCGDAVVGVIGQVDPKLLGKRKIRTALYAFELNLEALVELSVDLKLYQGIARVPAMTKDLAVIVDDGLSYQALEETIAASFAKTSEQVHQAFVSSGEDAVAVAPALEQVSCVDYYKGKPVPDGSKSLAIRLTFRAVGRTLTSEESQILLDGVVTALKEQHGAELRG